MELPRTGPFLHEEVVKAYARLYTMPIQLISGDLSIEIASLDGINGAVAAWKEKTALPCHIEGLPRRSHRMRELEESV